MGYRLAFDPVNRVLLGRFQGRLMGESATEFCVAFRRYMTATDARAGIVDLSSVTEFALVSESGADELLGQAPAMVDATKRPSIIVGTTTGFDLLWMSQIAGETAQSLPQVVHTMDEALAALGVRSPDFRGPTAPVRLEVLNLNSTVSETGKLLQRLLGEDIEQKIVLDPMLGPIKVDPLQIQQVIMNLAVNAGDAMPNGGQLRMETTNVTLGEDTFQQQGVSVRPGRYIMLAVSDTGLGMDAETQTHIFEPFYTTKPLGKGTGLGLTMAWRIIRESGGHIFVKSEPGSGTTFKIYLPQVDARTLLLFLGGVRCEVAAGTYPIR